MSGSSSGRGIYQSQSGGPISLVGWCFFYMPPVVSGLEGPGKEGMWVGQGRDGVEKGLTVHWDRFVGASFWSHPACHFPSTLIFFSPISLSFPSSGLQPVKPPSSTGNLLMSASSVLPSLFPSPTPSPASWDHLLGLLWGEPKLRQ